MKLLNLATTQAVLAVLLLNATPAWAQRQRTYERVLIQRSGAGRTAKPIVMGTHYAVTSMMPQATLAAQRVLEAGGNAFDAIVGGQAVLGLVAPSANGVGSDAVLLVYDAKAKKVWSINAEGAAPRLATIEWFEKNQPRVASRSPRDRRPKLILPACRSIQAARKFTSLAGNAGGKARSSETRSWRARFAG